MRNNITINPLTGVLASGSYTLFTYSGNLIGSFGTASTLAPSRYSLALDTSTPHVVKLTVTGTADTLEWNNGANNGQWDVQTSLNWSNLTTHTEDEFFTSDSVLFDDTILTAAHPTATIDVASGVTVAPSLVTVNSTTNYTITGAGAIGGGASVMKLGLSTLDIEHDERFLRQLHGGRRGRADQRTVAGGQFAGWFVHGHVVCLERRDAVRELDRRLSHRNHSGFGTEAACHRGRWCE